MRELFEKVLEESLFVHFPLKMEADRSLEKKDRDKPVEESHRLWDGRDTKCWSFEGDGSREFADRELRLSTQARSEHWPDREMRSFQANSGKYTTFGSFIARLDVSGLELSGGNRIAFRIKPDCPGAHSTMLRVGFKNDGAVKIPDTYSREGFHAVNLKNHQWNTCFWEIDSIAHDKITEISFEIHRYGKDVSTGDHITFSLAELYLQRVKPNVVHGWKCQQGSISYDTAADVSQQTVQSAEVTEGILTAALAVKDSSPRLYLRMMEEVNWGLDYILRMRFGDGYRAANASIRRWTDGLLGNFDDEAADVNNRFFENFIFAAVEAKAGEAFAQMDPELSWKLLEAAEEDYAFARERFERVGVEEAHMEEHTSSASLSQYYAAAALAAARLYHVTESNTAYRIDSLSYIQKVMDCQERGDASKGKKIPPLRGYFYRDEEKKHIVHFSHQARDQIFAMALEQVCRTFSEEPMAKLCENALRLHGEYLKNLNSYAAPYGMLPAGIYHVSECEDVKTFAVIHPNTTFAQEKENYREQLEQGIDLGDGYCIRMFPVWFSFRGNSAIQLSMGKSAAVIGKYFQDPELIQIAQNQLSWTLGKNPFRQSLIYGAGSGYAQEYTALLGETVGEIPVGVQTKGNEDLPYWPQACIATYREVWTTPAGKWLSLAGDIIHRKK
ncbi:MAG: glycoside hydrolase family 9 protein [Lachnospiraceae bacterium]|nr:glycoside hydrolase family 9 protein [Lachnospiraceae bacterium]